MDRLLLATRNTHKTREFIEILGSEFVVCDLGNEAKFCSIEETGESFEENAILKAVETSRQTPGLVVADDSGLEVDALHGAPGIYSARYAGENATDQENIVKLLNELVERSPTATHSARFRCCIALARNAQILQTFEGNIEGEIVMAPRGTNGFGYDPVFQPAGLDKTLAELSPAQKNQISHRANAIRSLRQALLKPGLK